MQSQDVGHVARKNLREQVARRADQELSREPGERDVQTLYRDWKKNKSFEERKQLGEEIWRRLQAREPAGEGEGGGTPPPGGAGGGGTGSGKGGGTITSGGGEPGEEGGGGAPEGGGGETRVGDSGGAGSGESGGTAPEKPPPPGVEGEGGYDEYGDDHGGVTTADGTPRTAPSRGDKAAAWASDDRGGDSATLPSVGSRWPLGATTAGHFGGLGMPALGTGPKSEGESGGGQGAGYNPLQDRGMGGRATPTQVARAGGLAHEFEGVGGAQARLGSGGGPSAPGSSMAGQAIPADYMTSGTGQAGGTGPEQGPGEGYSAGTGQHPSALPPDDPMQQFIDPGRVLSGLRGHIPPPYAGGSDAGVAPGSPATGSGGRVGGAGGTPATGGSRAGSLAAQPTGAGGPAQPSPFQGALSGNWSGNCKVIGRVNGPFSATIAASGGVQGSFSGSNSGPIQGKVASSRRRSNPRVSSTSSSA